MPASTATTPLLDVRRIYLEPAAAELPRGQEVLARWPEAELVEVASHWRIPELHGNAGNVADWNRIKGQTLVLGVKSSRSSRPNGRSSDFIAPSLSNGCTMSCAYCYVPRRKGYANPITTFVNIEQLCASIERHVRKQGVKPAPNEVDPSLWVYDIGENSDCSFDARISENVRDVVELFKRLPTAKCSFATKHVNRDLLGWEMGSHPPQRIRFSLMPHEMAKLLDVRTSPVAERIAAVGDFVEAGWEVHLNFSPVVVTEGWTSAWAELLTELDDVLPQAAKDQLKAEVIFLTHNEGLHEVNLGWHPKAEEVLWRPDLQEPKRSQTGGWNVRYQRGKKAKMVATFRELVARHLPSCEIRYAF